MPKFLRRLALALIAVLLVLSPTTALAAPTDLTPGADAHQSTGKSTTGKSTTGKSKGHKHKRHGDTHRVIAFYQTIYETGSDGVRRYVDPKPLIPHVSDINMGAIHLNDDLSLHVNDIPANHPELVPMWKDLRKMQRKGIRVSAFVGGAAPGTYRNLATDFDTYYPILRDFLRKYKLDGVDLDIEEPFSLENTIKLVKRLRADFGPRFVITLTPVAADLAGWTTFSGGFEYSDLEAQAGSYIDWYNAQFYCGWGDLRSTLWYDRVVANGFAPERFVAGTVTNPANCGGYVQPEVFDQVVTELVARYPTFGGIFGWEYFNSLGHDGGGRETWFSHVRDLVGEPPHHHRR